MEECLPLFLLTRPAVLDIIRNESRRGLGGGLAEGLGVCGWHSGERPGSSFRLPVWNGKKPNTLGS